MKTCIITILALLSSAHMLMAQLYVEGVRLTELNTSQYLEVVPLRTNEARFHVIADYGQNRRAQLTDNDFVSDANGRRLDFRSPVDAINYCYENGWEIKEVYVFDNIRRFLLQRRTL